ncbi:MAG: hypothetical protein Q8N81_04040 [bacterium]|nr:hypothetical protein [bacterium]
MESVSSGRVSLSNGVVFTLPVSDIKECEIAAGDQVTVPGGDLHNSVGFSLTIFQTNRHKADVALTRNHSCFAGRVTLGTRVSRESVFPFSTR